MAGEQPAESSALPVKGKTIDAGPTIYLVSTPIGNLADTSLRALDTLRNVDVILSEDTRKTNILLNHFGIRKPQIPFHEHNELRSLGKITELIRRGKSVALVTDAGTPGISDPGFALVRRAIEEELSVTVIPGPSAFVMALILSGLPVHAFTFRGFPPRKSGPRRRFFEVDKASPHTLIFYESPHRLVAFFEDAITVFGDRNAALACELTKMFETVKREKLSCLLDGLNGKKPRGEYTVVIAGVPTRAKHSNENDKEKDHGA